MCRKKQEKKTHLKKQLSQCSSFIGNVFLFSVVFQLL